MVTRWEGDCGVGIKDEEIKKYKWADTKLSLRYQVKPSEYSQ